MRWTGYFAHAQDALLGMLTHTWFFHSKDHEISEWIYEVFALPKIWTEKFEKFCPFSNFFVHFLGNATTSYIHSEISWPLTMIFYAKNIRNQFLKIRHVSSGYFILKLFKSMCRYFCVYNQLFAGQKTPLVSVTFLYH